MNSGEGPARRPPHGDGFGEPAFHRRRAIVGGVDVELLGVLVVVEVGGVEDRAKGLVRDDLGAGLLAESHGATEVIGVGVGDDHRVDVTRR